MSAYTKPKDKYIAALIVFAGFVCIPFTIVWYLLWTLIDEIIDSWRSLRKEFEGGPIVTAKYAHKCAMEGMRYRRARRETRRFLEKVQHES